MPYVPWRKVFSTFVIFSPFLQANSESSEPSRQVVCAPAAAAGRGWRGCRARGAQLAAQGRRGDDLHGLQVEGRHGLKAWELHGKGLSSLKAHCLVLEDVEEWGLRLRQELAATEDLGFSQG